MPGLLRFLFVEGRLFKDRWRSRRSLGSKQRLGQQRGEVLEVDAEFGSLLLFTSSLGFEFLLLFLLLLFSTFGTLFMSSLYFFFLINHSFGCFSIRGFCL